MSARVGVLLSLVVAIGGCSRGPERSAALSPTAPTAGSLLGASGVAPGGISGPMDVAFPGRNESFDFRNQLETKYQTGLNRSASSTFVDREGEVVWVQEYIRYRVNGCDHVTASQRVLAQVDGNPPGQVCGAAPEGAIAFPPRDQAMDFRRLLEAKYQQMQRGLTSTFVDMEGGVIWLQEYLRYRLNSCDHPTSVQKVFSQIDGGGVAPTCFVPPPACSYRLTPSFTNVGPGNGTSAVELFAVPGGCDWTVTSNASWVTISPPTTGNGPALVTYAVQANQGGARSATVRFDWAGGSTSHEVNQAATPFNVQFQLFDPGQSTAATTVCQIRTASTPCNFVATANLTGTQTFAWTATYLYGTQKTFTQSGASATFGFTEACGGPDSSASGSDVDLDVTLTVTDTNGNAQTVRSGQGSLPALKLRRFTC